MLENNMVTEKMICPCCGLDYVKDEYDICLTCGWEYDPVQNDKPNRKGGANRDSLNEHREWFLKNMKRIINLNGVIPGKTDMVYRYPVTQCSLYL